MGSQDSPSLNICYFLVAGGSVGWGRGGGVSVSGGEVHRGLTVWGCGGGFLRWVGTDRGKSGGQLVGDKGLTG